MAKQPTLIIPEERIPSYINRHIVTGAKFGLVAALGVAAAVTVPYAATGIAIAEISSLALFGSGAVAGVAAAIGSGIGCVRGKDTIAKNITSGRTVNSPSVFNEGMMHGLLNGAILTLAAITTSALLGPASVFGVGTFAILGAAVTAFAGYYQGKNHQEFMQNEYEAAKSKAIVKEKGAVGKLLDVAQDAGKTVGKTAEVAVSTVGAAANIAKVTAEESADLASKLKDGVERTTDWREKINKLEKQTELSV